MKAGDKGPTEVELVCLHVMRYVLPPKAGETVWCDFCKDYRLVKTEPSTCKVRCRSCRMGRLFGSNDKAARVMATQHVIKYPRHVVALTVPEGTEEIRNTETPFPGSGEWHRQHPAHQKSLRQVGRGASVTAEVLMGITKTYRHIDGRNQ